MEALVAIVAVASLAGLAFVARDRTRQRACALNGAIVGAEDAQRRLAASSARLDSIDGGQSTADPPGQA